MGLDLVEYVLALESAFGIEIPDADAAHLETPRLLIDYLVTRLPMTAAKVGTPYCLTQRAFYRARAATAQHFGVARQSLRPESDLRSVIGERTADWKAMRFDVGARDWPRLRGQGWWASQLGGVATLGELARHLALYDTALVRSPGASWTRTEVEALALQLLERETGVEMSKYTLDSRFVMDMGLD